MKSLRYSIVISPAAAIVGCGSGEQGSEPVAEQSRSHQYPYAVGSSTFFIHDKSRGYDVAAGVTGGVRTLLTEIWYPADHESIDADPGGYRLVTYGDYVFGNREVHQLMMTKTTFLHMTPETVRDGVSGEQIDAAIDELSGRRRGSFVDAPLAATDADLPLVCGLLRDSNHATFGVSGGYWWPDLKPNTQEKYFEPGTTFVLSDVQRAHDMQRKKTLAFFDLTIRQNPTAKDVLLDQSFAGDGLILESRNF